MWLLAWTPHALTHHIDPPYSRVLSFPTGSDIAWNPLSPLLGLFGWPFLLLGGPALDYNVVMTLGMAATAWAGYLSVCHWVKSRALGIFGGLLLLASPYVYGQSLAHPSLAVFPTLPLSAIALHEAWGRRRWNVARAGLALGACWLGVLLISTEMFGSLALMTGVLAVCCGLYHRTTWRSWWKRATQTTVIGIATVLPYVGFLLWGMLRLPGRIIRQTIDPATHAGTLLNFVSPNSSRFVGLKTVEGLGVVEEGLYVGIPILILLIWGLWRTRCSTVAAAWCAVAAAAAVLALGPQLLIGGHRFPLPEAALTHMPLGGEFVPLRFGLYVSLAVAMAVPLLVDGLRQGARASAGGRLALHRRIGLALLLILGIASWVPRLPPTVAVGPTPAALADRVQRAIVR
jgi:dolichyl-phosphate beta-glucosyltransferase